MNYKSAERQSHPSGGCVSTLWRRTGHLLSLYSGVPDEGLQWPRVSTKRERASKRGSERPKTDLKHSNQSVIWPRAKSWLIISQSEHLGGGSLPVRCLEALRGPELSLPFINSSRPLPLSAWSCEQPGLLGNSVSNLWGDPTPRGWGSWGYNTSF